VTRTNVIVGLRIKERRKELGMLQSELARRLGIDATNLSAIEHGRQGVSADRLVKLAEILECDLLAPRTP
jgi:transcriptional regulator with XRE-family HTH domain